MSSGLIDGLVRSSCSVTCSRLVARDMLRDDGARMMQLTIGGRMTADGQDMINNVGEKARSNAIAQHKLKMQILAEQKLALKQQESKEEKHNEKGLLFSARLSFPFPHATTLHSSLSLNHLRRVHSLLYPLRLPGFCSWLILRGVLWGGRGSKGGRVGNRAQEDGLQRRGHHFKGFSRPRDEEVSSYPCACPCLLCLWLYRSLPTDEDILYRASAPPATGLVYEQSAHLVYSAAR